MKNFLLAVTLLMGLNSISYSQNYFEGKIIYKLDFKSKNPDITADMLKSYLGNGLTLLFKQGNYYHRFDGGIYEFELYNKADNKSYLKKRDNDTIYWSDCSVPGDKIQEFKLTGKKETILGIVCNQILVRYKKKTEIHYYNSDSVAINPAWFKNFKQDDEYLVDQKEKSIYLKSENEFDEFTAIETAVKITREPVDEKIFKLPGNAILVKQK
jgi:hypothetical protein